MEDRVSVTLSRRYIYRTTKRKEAHGPGQCDIPLDMARDLVGQGVLPESVLAVGGDITVAELREQAKEAGITGYYDMRKDELIRALESEAP